MSIKDLTERVERLEAAITALGTTIRVGDMIVQARHEFLIELMQERLPPKPLDEILKMGGPEIYMHVQRAAEKLRAELMAKKDASDATPL